MHDKFYDQPSTGIRLGGMTSQRLSITLSVALWFTAAALAAQSDTPLRGEEAVAAVKQPGAHDRLSAAYPPAVYGVQPTDGGRHQAWNVRQQITARSHP